MYLLSFYCGNLNRNITFLLLAPPTSSFDIYVCEYMYVYSQAHVCVWNTCRCVIIVEHATYMYYGQSLATATLLKLQSLLIPYL